MRPVDLSAVSLSVVPYHCDKKEENYMLKNIGGCRAPSEQHSSNTVEDVEISCCCINGNGMRVPQRNFFWMVVVFIFCSGTIIVTIVVCLTAWHTTSALAPTFTAATTLINNVNMQTTTLGNETALLMGSVQDHWSIPAVTLNLNPDAAPAEEGPQFSPTEKENKVTQLAEVGGGGGGVSAKSVTFAPNAPYFGEDFFYQIRLDI